MAYGKRGAMKRGYGAAVKGARSMTSAKTRKKAAPGSAMNRKRQKVAGPPKKRPVARKKRMR